MQHCFYFTGLALSLALILLNGCKREPRVLDALISGPSMGTTFPGKHRTFDCRTCRHRMIIDDYRPKNARIFCALCETETDYESSRPMPETTVNILTGENVSRWDVVAVSMPNKNETKRFAIKRVIGLPGETLSFRQGNLIINDRIFRKSIAEQRQLSTMVFDLEHAAGPGLFNKRWKPPAGVPDSSWNFRSGAVYFEPVPGAGESKFSSILFSPPHPFPHNAEMVDPFAIYDHFSFNQAVSSRLNRVEEFLIELSVVPSADCQLQISLGAGENQSIFHFDFAKTSALRVEAGGVRQTSDRPFTQDLRPLKITCSNIDQNLSVLINDQTVFQKQVPFAPDHNSSREKDGRPSIAIGGAVKPFQIRKLTVSRDIFLDWSFEPDSPDQTERSVKISKDSFFLIGDNLAVSRDSRIWDPPTISRSRIVGTVRAVPLKTPR